MSELTFVTGNTDKFVIAQEICAASGITLAQANLDIDEVQSENGEYIARKKAEAAFTILQKPLIVRDDSWAFLGLQGFPGPYMKSINHWFSNEDFVRLIHGLDDKRAILTQIIVFTDGKTEKIFKHETTAYLLDKPKGNSISPSENVMTIEGDNGLSIAEVMASGNIHADRAPAAAWHEFTAWYKEYAA